MTGVTSQSRTGRVRVERSGDYFVVRGEMETTVTLACDRCLENYSQPVHAQIYAVLVSADLLREAGAESVELTSQDLDITSYEGEEFDLEPIVQEQIILSLPLRHVCGEECLGICPKCGANRNRTPCQCSDNGPESPFSVLKKLKI
ncbi:MAG: DUF177 domain-containing protein [Deltaproteobacteria bacterium]|nr:DUF177 domain-containing protein [Deltaproteobacteria bacterium]